MKKAKPSALPRRWLFTDGSGAMPVFPPGVGVVARDYGRPDRAAWALALATRRRGQVTLLAGLPRQALAARMQGAHLPSWLLHRVPGKVRRPHRHFCLTAAVHGRRELVQARRVGVDMVFLSPVFATLSHPGMPPLGLVRAGLVRRSGAGTMPVAALGGVTTERINTLKRHGFYGWGAIRLWHQRGR